MCTFILEASDDAVDVSAVPFDKALIVKSKISSAIVLTLSAPSKTFLNADCRP